MTLNKEEKNNDEESTSSIGPGYTRDCYGHIRPDLEYERRRKEELEREFRDRL